MKFVLICLVDVVAFLVVAVVALAGAAAIAADTMIHLQRAWYLERSWPKQ